MDNGVTLFPFLNRVAQAANGYTRLGVLTLNNFSLGGSISSSGSAAFFATRVYALVAVKRMLKSGEITLLSNYLAGKMGVVL
jgi:hypothetical protein